MANMAKLKAVMAQKNESVKSLSEAIGVDRSTFYRRLGQEGETFLIKELRVLTNVLGLSHQEAIDIFLSKESHK